MELTCIVIDQDLPPPSFTRSPGDEVAGARQEATFTEETAGYPAPTSPWQFSTNGGTYININAATGPSLCSLIFKSGLTNIGYYHIRAANSVSTNTSARVSLTYLNLNKYAGLNILGPLGANHQIQSIPALNGGNWIVPANVSLPSQPHIHMDHNPPTNARRFSAPGRTNFSSGSKPSKSIVKIKSIKP
jgi:hypothetical protein